MPNKKARHVATSANRDHETATIIPFHQACQREYDTLSITEEEAERRLAVICVVDVLGMRSLGIKEWCLTNWLLFRTIYGRVPCIASVREAMEGNDWLPPVRLSRSSYYRALRGLEEKGLISRKRFPTGTAIWLHIDEDFAMKFYRHWESTGRKQDAEMQE